MSEPLETMQKQLMEIKQQFVESIDQTIFEQSESLNVVMMMLTILTVLLLPFQLISCIFGVNVPVPMQTSWEYDESEDETVGDSSSSLYWRKHIRPILPFCMILLACTICSIFIYIWVKYKKLI